MTLPKKNLAWYFGLLIILFLAASIRFWHLKSPPFAVYDERHNATMATQYLSGRPFIDIHPPVARFHFAAVALLVDADPSHRITAILQPYNDFPYVALRSVSTFAGIALVLFSALLSQKITKSSAAGLLTGILVTFENSFILYSRLILPDMLLLAYGTAGLWCFFNAVDTPPKSKVRAIWLAGTVFLFSLAAGIKITGFIFPAVAIFFTLIQPPKTTMAYSFQKFKTLIIYPAIIVTVFMFIHFLLLSPTGPVYSTITDIPIDTFDYFRQDDSLHLKNSFIASLYQRTGETVLGQLFTLSAEVSDTDALATSSPAWMWPFMQKPMTFSIIKGQNGVQIIYLIGNPVIWLGGLVILIYLLLKKIQNKEWQPKTDIFIVGYLLYMLIMALIRRPLFITTYLPALLFLMIITSCFVSQRLRHKPRLIIALVGLIVLSFLYMAPYSLNLSLSPQALQNRTTFHFWNPLNDPKLKIIH